MKRINPNRDREIPDKTEEISVRGRLKKTFWKNELKPSLFIQYIIDNGCMSWIASEKCYETNPEAVVRCSVEKMFVEIFQNIQENTCARVSFLIKV